MNLLNLVAAEGGRFTSCPPKPKCCILELLETKEVMTFGKHHLPGGLLAKEKLFMGMLKRVSMACCVLSVLLFFILPSTILAARQPLRLAYPPFPPFHWVDESGTLKGFFYDIITEALEKRMGVPVVWSPYPWARCQENLRYGKVDAIITVPTPERLNYSRTHSVPLYRKTLHLFTYAGHPQLEQIRQVKDIADLKTYDLTVITYSGNGWHKDNVESLGIKSYMSSNLENVWLMLAHRRGDVVIEWPAAATPDLFRLGLGPDIIDTGIVISSMSFHLLIRGGYKHADMIGEFDAVLAAMKEDGTLDAIMERW